MKKVTERIMKVLKKVTAKKINKVLKIDFDINGFLNVDATNESTGKSDQITINNEKGCLSQAETSHRAREIMKFKGEEEDRNGSALQKNWGLAGEEQLAEKDEFENRQKELEGIVDASETLSAECASEVLPSLAGTADFAVWAVICSCLRPVATYNAQSTTYNRRMGAVTTWWPVMKKVTERIMKVLKKVTAKKINKVLKIDFDINGFLNVDATNESTGKSDQITINNEKGCLSQAETSHRAREIMKFKGEEEDRNGSALQKNWGLAGEEQLAEKDEFENRQKELEGIVDASETL
ncbi:unnamed protein product, partial [Polarella glacialis]